MQRLGLPQRVPCRPARPNASPGRPTSHCVAARRSWRPENARHPAWPRARWPLVLTLALWLAPWLGLSAARAHEGHDDAPAAAVRPAPASALPAAGPQRLPDGAIALPKASQRQLGVRTALAVRQATARAVELPGLVAIDPNAGGQVQATVAGRIEPGPGGLPTVGQAVARGQVLAVVRATIDPLARSNRSAQLAELRAAHALATRRAARLRELADTVPRKEIEAADSERASLAGRIGALSGGLDAAERLAAPVAGVVASANAVAGQVVDAREVLFQIVDPTRLRIEASAFDAALAADVDGATVAVGGQAVPLDFVGAGRVLREQAVLLVFRARHAALARLAVGQPVAVTVRTRASAEGAALAAGAIVRNAANEPIAWVKTAPERFEPRRVRAQPLDGARVLVTDGLSGGERVVVEGAPLLNQVR